MNKDMEQPGVKETLQHGMNEDLKHDEMEQPGVKETPEGINDDLKHSIMQQPGK